MFKEPPIILLSYCSKINSCKINKESGIKKPWFLPALVKDKGWWIYRSRDKAKVGGRSGQYRKKKCHRVSMKAKRIWQSAWSEAVYILAWLVTWGVRFHRSVPQISVINFLYSWLTVQRLHFCICVSVVAFFNLFFFYVSVQNWTDKCRISKQR